MTTTTPSLATNNTTSSTTDNLSRTVAVQNTARTEQLMRGFAYQVVDHCQQLNAQANLVVKLINSPTYVGADFKNINVVNNAIPKIRTYTEALKSEVKAQALTIQGLSSDALDMLTQETINISELDRTQFSKKARLNSLAISVPRVQKSYELANAAQEQLSLRDHPSTQYLIEAVFDLQATLHIMNQAITSNAETPTQAQPGAKIPDRVDSTSNQKSDSDKKEAAIQDGDKKISLKRPLDERGDASGTAQAETVNKKVKQGDKESGEERNDEVERCLQAQDVSYELNELSTESVEAVAAELDLDKDIEADNETMTIVAV